MEFLLIIKGNTYYKHISYFQNQNYSWVSITLFFIKIEIFNILSQEY